MDIAEQVIAKSIRDLRQRHRLTLKQVAEKANLSKGFLSKVERCNVSISIAALSRLATVFRVSLGEFFDTEESESDVIYVPSGRGRSIVGNSPRPPYQYEVLVPRRGVRQMQPVVISVNGRTTKFELREHPGEQFIFMLEGEINYICGNRKFTLRTGDCLYFNARISHGPKPKRNQNARYLAVFTTDSHQRHRRNRG